MTPDELRKYREQIAKLKKDFHKENPQNIELSSNSTEAFTELSKLEKITKLTENPVLDKLKQIELNSTKPPVDEPKAIDFSQNRITQEKTISTNHLKEKPVIQSNYSSSEEKTVATSSSKEKLAQASVNEVSKIKTIVPPVIPPKKEIIEEEPEKSSIFKYILLLLFLILAGLAAFYFFNKNSKKKAIKKEKERIERAYSDSVNTFDQEKLKQEIDAKYNTENGFNRISDTIYQLQSLNPEGYYVVIGSYSELKNAKILKKKQKTAFDSYLFEQDKIRVALKISSDEDQVFNNLNEVKNYYPDAWLLYNKN